MLMSCMDMKSPVNVRMVNRQVGEGNGVEDFSCDFYDPQRDACPATADGIAKAV